MNTATQAHTITAKRLKRAWRRWNDEYETSQGKVSYKNWLRAEIKRFPYSRWAEACERALRS